MVGADRNDTSRIDVVVRDVVVPLDMVEIHSLSDAVGLVEVSEIPEEIWEIDDSPKVALKMTVVHRIKPNQRDKEPPVRFHQLRSE